MMVMIESSLFCPPNLHLDNVFGHFPRPKTRCSFGPKGGGVLVNIQPRQVF